jgi:hypothetical protein
MDPTQIPVWERVFNLPYVNIPSKTLYLLSELTFEGEGSTSAEDYLCNFFYKCLKHNIIDLNIVCKLFALNFRGRVKCWFESFPTNSIHSLFEFGTQFLSDFNNSDYDKLGEELNCLRKENDESLEDFEIRLIHLCTRFPLKEIPLIDEWFQYLIYLSDEQDQLIVNQFELGINTHSQFGLNCHEDLENLRVVEAQPCLPTSLILEKHDILKDAIVPPDNSFSSMSSSDDKETLNKDNGHTIQYTTTISKEKEIAYDICDYVINKYSPNSFEPVQDQLMGDDIIIQTINQPSYSSGLLSHFPLHNEPNFLLETISYSLKEHTIGVD